MERGRDTERSGWGWGEPRPGSLSSLSSLSSAEPAREVPGRRPGGAPASEKGGGGGETAQRAAQEGGAGERGG
eukprot:2307697-Rhodomonas_salina.1